ncbi:MAG: hypothetical protein WKG00_13005 [Polyangiaceae bacterium]
MSKPEEDDEPQVPNVSVDTVRPPAPSAGDLYSSATVLRQVPQELIEAARARRRGRAPDVPEAPPAPPPPSFDPFPVPSDDMPSLEVGYTDADDEALDGTDATSEHGTGRRGAGPGVSDLSGDARRRRAFAGAGAGFDGSASRSHPHRR